MPANKAGYLWNSALHSLIDKIGKTITQKEIAFEVFLDIEGAFDSIYTKSIVIPFEDHSIPLLSPLQFN